MDNSINSGKQKKQELLSLLEESDKLGEKLLNLRLLNESDIDKIIDYQEILYNKGEILSFWEIIFSSSNMSEINRKRIIDFIKDNGIELNSKEKLKFENFKLKGIVTHQKDTSIKTKEVLNTPTKPRIGEALIKANFITQRDLDKALDYQAEKKKEGKIMMIGEIIMLLGMIDKKKFLNFVQTHNYSMRTGELLMAHNLIDGEQLENAMILQKECEKEGVKRQLGDILVEDMGIVSKERLLKVVAQQKNMIRMKPSVSEIDPRLVFLFQKERLKTLNFLPYKIFNKYKEEAGGKAPELSGYIITVLSDDCVGNRVNEIKKEILKKSSEIRNEIKKSTLVSSKNEKESEEKLTIDIVFAYSVEEELMPFIDDCFENEENLKKIGNTNMIGGEEYIGSDSDIFNIGKGFRSKNNQNINIFADILMKSLNLGASDIHIEPERDKIRVRSRIDGALQTIMELPVQIKSGFVNSLKMYFKFKDGHVKGKVFDSRKSVFYHDKNQEVDLRFSIVPTVHGDKIVSRLLVQTETIPTLQELGMQKNLARKYELICSMSNGIVIVTGPTGSGKTTTLQATLLSLNSDEKNITTIEDPPEYMIKGVNQIDAGGKHGLSFNEVVKGILRQDPDILMFGEMRDLESAQNALTAGLTGRLLFTTLHTNDSISAITRLIDMGIRPFLLGSTLVSIAGQRLVRKVCQDCKIEYTPEYKDLHYFRRYLKDMDKYIKDNNIKFYKGKGCDCCRHTGYKGRIGIVELFCVNDELKIGVLEGKTASQLEAIARRYGMTSMTEDGFCRILDGETTIEEVLRVTKTLQFPKLKRTVEDIKYLLNGDMSQQEIEDAIYGVAGFEETDVGKKLVEVLEKENEILEEGVQVEKKICANEEHMALLAESNNRLVSNNTLVMNKLIETQSKLIDALTGQNKETK